jgi:hypothetical protein
VPDRRHYPVHSGAEWLEPEDKDCMMQCFALLAVNVRMVENHLRAKTFGKTLRQRFSKPETKVGQQSPIVSDKTIEQLNGRDAPHEN